MEQTERTTSCAKAFGEVAEVKRLNFIAPVLVCVCALFDGDTQIFVEESVEGKRVYGDGKFEFVIKSCSKRLNIVVARESDTTQGLALAYIGSEVLTDVEGLHLQQRHELHG
ncbi:hypothetical protein P3T76_009063 [Phytophthora citrophthora]|uniref:Uncharacterized protein n=1 Tax=Phytophthora citrophthora TaxID=4793 RepID=A0AAD9GIV9_9STRA|nr:hypothetical protein P3T76_009063 [Phytophthora citrophthora]